MKVICKLDERCLVKWEEFRFYTNEQGPWVEYEIRCTAPIPEHLPMPENQDTSPFVQVITTDEAGSSSTTFFPYATFALRAPASKLHEFMQHIRKYTPPHREQGARTEVMT